MLPTVFISADNDAEKSGAKSMHAAQKFVAANILNPAASAIAGKAIAVIVKWLPLNSNTAASPIPTHTAVILPVLRLVRRATTSENHPPTGASTAIARNGADVHTAACKR